MPVASFWPLPAPYVPPANPGYPAPNLGEDDFVTDLADLFPPGKAWAWVRDAGSVGIGMLHALAASQAVTQARKNNLLNESPVTAGTLVELLPEWESSLGLPDPCAGPDASIAGRQSHVLARIKNQGGQSIPYLIGYAADLGFAVTITPYAVFRCGARAGMRVLGTAWATTIRISSSTTFRVMRCGSARCGDPLASWGAAATTFQVLRCGARAGGRLRTWGNAVLECELRRIAPGHLYVLFAYSTNVSLN